jgi:hypothetical protein
MPFDRLFAPINHHPTLLDMSPQSLDVLSALLVRDHVI